MSEHHNFSHDSTNPATQLREELLKNPEAMQKPKNLLKLEIGSAQATGFDPLELAERGATIVTVNLPNNLDVKGPYAGKEKLDELSAQAEYPYTFIPLTGDSRNMDYFEDGTFGEVMLQGVVSDRSITATNVAQLLTEALRVGDKVLVNSGTGAYVTKFRLDKSNLREAGIIRKTVKKMDKHGWDSEEVLMKGDDFGQVPLALPIASPSSYEQYVDPSGHTLANDPILHRKIRRLAHYGMEKVLPLKYPLNK